MIRTWDKWEIEAPHGPEDWYWLSPRTRNLYTISGEIKAWCDDEFGNRRLEKRWFPFGNEYAIRAENDVLAFLLRWG